VSSFLFVAPNLTGYQGWGELLACATQAKESYQSPACLNL
jgi:hypothetical protein